VDAAERLFLRRDFPEVNMSGVADEAGISRPTLYKYFPSLDDLALAVEMRAMDALYRVEEAWLEGEGRAIERIEGLLRELGRLALESPAHLRFSGLFDHHYRSGYSSKAMAESYGDFLGRFDRIERLVAEGMADGSLRADLEAHRTAYAIGNAFLALLQRVASRGELLEIEQRIRSSDILDDYIEMALAWVAPPGGGRGAEGAETGRRKP
jgi:AcrR family transcriptional regulator